MKNDAFDLRWWSLDQALIWISSRDPKAVVSGSSWVNFRAVRLEVWNPETREEVYEHADPVVHPQKSEQLLLRHLQDERIEGLNGMERLPSVWFDQAEFSRNQVETLLVNRHLPASVQITKLSGDQRYIERINPDENKLRVRVPSAQVLACFPAQEQVATPQESQANVGDLNDGLNGVPKQASAFPDSQIETVKRRRDHMKGDEQLQRGLRAMDLLVNRLRKSNKLPQSARALAKVILDEEPDLRERVGGEEVIRKIIGGAHDRSNHLAEQGLVRRWWPVDLPNSGSNG